MSMSPAGLLAKLDELKKWQQIQQERLLKQHNSRLEATNNTSAFETIQGLSAFDSSHHSPETSHVGELVSQENVPNKPKQPFLRRGTGLQKFGMQSGDQMRPFHKMKVQKTAVHKRLAQLRKAEKSNQIVANGLENSDREKMSDKGVESEKKGKQSDKLKSVSNEKVVQSGRNKKVLQSDKSKKIDKIYTKTNENHNKVESKRSGKNTPLENMEKVGTLPKNSNKEQSIEDIRLIEEGSSLEEHHDTLDLHKFIQPLNAGNFYNPDNYPSENLENNSRNDPDKNTENMYFENYQNQIGRSHDQIENLNLNQFRNQNYDGLGDTNYNQYQTSEEGFIDVNKKSNFNQTQSDELQRFLIQKQQQLLEPPTITPLKMPEVNILPKAQWVKNEDHPPNGKENSDIINQINEIASGRLKPQTPNLLQQCVEQLAAEKFGHRDVSADESDLLAQIQALLANSNTTIQTPDAHKNLLMYLQDLVRMNGTTDSLNSTEYERTIEKELRTFEQLEQKVMHSSFCSTNSSVLELLSSTPLKFVKQNVEKKMVHFNEGNGRVKSSVKKVLDFQGSDESSVDLTDFEEKTVLEENNNSEGTETLSSETTSCSSVISMPPTKVVVKQNACVMTDDLDFTQFSQNGDDEMRRKIKELDREIANFRTENAKLQKLKGDVEKERKELGRSRKKMEKELLEERTKMEYELEEEKKKFGKEKMVFERYVKDLQNKPSKKEREEVSLLKTELANVKETLKLKETRNGTTQARLRNQLKSTERENANLKEEIERLQKQNARLTATQKIVSRKPSDTKMLHEINKNLTKLAQDAKVAKHCNKAEKSVEKLDDSLIMLEKRRKSGGQYETEYQRSYSRNDNNNSDESDNLDDLNCDEEDSSRAKWQKIATKKSHSRNRKSYNEDESDSDGREFDCGRSNKSATGGSDRSKFSTDIPGRNNGSHLEHTKNRSDGIKTTGYSKNNIGVKTKKDTSRNVDFTQNRDHEANENIESRYENIVNRTTNNKTRNENTNHSRKSNNQDESDEISWSRWSRNKDENSMDETDINRSNRSNRERGNNSMRQRLQQKCDENSSDRRNKSRVDDEDGSYQDKTILSDKENDRNATNFDFTTFRNLSLEDSYDRMFGGREVKMRNNSLNDTQASAVGKTETILEDGTKETKYPNGNIKLTSADGNIIKLNYFNGDIKETKLLEGVIKYYYAESEMWQTTLPSGEEVMEFSDGQVEKHFVDGAMEVQFANGVIKHTAKDGTETITYPDGSVVTTKNDEKVLLLPNGQKEYHTKDQKRREYPDGTIKILYPDGLQETRYSNGRIRMKDKDGHLLMDTHSDDL